MDRVDDGPERPAVGIEGLDGEPLQVRDGDAGQGRADGAGEERDLTVPGALEVLRGHPGLGGRRSRGPGDRGGQTSAPGARETECERG